MPASVIQSVTELNAQFSIPNLLRFESGEGNLTRAVITAPSAEAHVYLHGAHVTHYQPAGQSPVLFMSRESHFAPDKPIRGGIPVIFPWFGPRAGDPAAPAHGFARTMEWSVVETKPTGSAVGITLALKPSDATRRWFGHDDEEWPGMLCIETANAAENAVTLAPGQSHVVSASISGGAL